MLWMLSPACAIVVEICPSMFGTFALAIATRYGDSRGISTFGKVDGVGDRAVLEVLAHLVDDHHRAVLLGLLGRRAQVRQRDDAAARRSSRALGKSQR